MAAIYTRVGTPAPGRRTEAYKFVKERAQALHAQLGITQEVFIRIGGTVGQVCAVSRHNSLEELVINKQKVVKASMEGKIPNAPDGLFLKVSESLWTEP